MAWSKKHIKCIVCGKTTSEHASKGRCRRCWDAQWSRDNREAKLLIQKNFYRRLKLEVLTYYSKGDYPACECCREMCSEFLAIDHIDGGGTKHRQKMKLGGSGFYVWLKKQGFPKGYRVLCHNCNASYGYYNYCPHKGGNGI